MSEQSKLVYNITVGIDKCKGACGTTLSYPPITGNTTICPNCKTVHTILDGGLLELEESE